MNAYFKTNDSSSHSAVRNMTKAVKLPSGWERVPATAKLRKLAKISAIPTYRVMNNGTLGLM
jgi:hypothetical protein